MAGNSTEQPTTSRPADTLALVVESLQGLQFGSVTIIVQDGVIVQVDRTEKRRLLSRGRHSA